jgi:outer membrane protein assembly factor BamB
MIRHISPIVALLLVAACGGGRAPSTAFSKSWNSDSGETAARLEQRLRGAPRPANVAVAVGVTETALVGSELPAGRSWRRAGAVDSMPSIAANGMVFGTGDGEVFGLDGRSGNPVFSVSASGYRLRGGADDGTFSVLSLAKERTSRLLVVNRQGGRVLDLTTDEALGRPAIRAGIAFVPWGGQYVSAIDVTTGVEQARLLLRELVSHALDVGGTLFFGERALVRFDDKIKFAESFQATRFAFEPRKLPGTPRWLPNGTEPELIDRTALPKIRLYAQPEAASVPVRLANEGYAASYFRAVYGFAADGKLRFTDAFASDTLGGASAASGYAFCDAGGKVHLYDRAGGLGPVLDLGSRLVACSVGASGLEVPAGRPRGSLAEQIESTVTRLDASMAAAEKLLIGELATIQDPSVTRILIGFAEDPRLPPEERKTAGVLLSKRRNGEDEMLAALGRHYDFVSGEQPPPLGPIADALAAVGDQRAAPLLARHLNDPANELDDIERAAAALETLATRAEAGELRTFFALYRATADEPSLVAAVISAAKALVRVGGAESRALLDRAAADPLTQPDVQRGITKLLAPDEEAAPAPAAANSAAESGKAAENSRSPAR